LKEFYPHQSADSKNSADLRLQVAHRRPHIMPVTLVYTSMLAVRLASPPTGNGWISAGVVTLPPTPSPTAAFYCHPGMKEI